MTVEATNPDDFGSDNGEPSDALDNPSNLDFYDPDEDNAEEQSAGNEPDSETDEAEDGQEADEEAEASDEDGNAAEESEEDATEPEPSLTLADGTKLTASEVQQGYMRLQDYTRKTQEVSTKRQDVERLAERVSKLQEAIYDSLAAELPEEPDASLAFSNYQEYVQRAALHKQALDRINKIGEIASQAKSVKDEIGNGHTQERIEREKQMLAERIPSVATPKGQQKFFEEAFAGARELGFSDDELKSQVDHRLFVTAYWARKGLEAEAAKKKVGQKVAKAPPVTPNRRAAGKPDAAKNRDAMKRLAKTGSIHDALAVDFD